MVPEYSCLPLSFIEDEMINLPDIFEKTDIIQKQTFSMKLKMLQGDCDSLFRLCMLITYVFKLFFK